MTVLLTIAVVGFLGYCMRAVFIVSLAKHAFPPLALRVLEYVAPAVMGALVMTMLTGARGHFGHWRAGGGGFGGSRRGGRSHPQCWYRLDLRDGGVLDPGERDQLTQFSRILIDVGILHHPGAQLSSVQ